MGLNEMPLRKKKFTNDQKLCMTKGGDKVELKKMNDNEVIRV